jgi:hypothetical protein
MKDPKDHKKPELPPLDSLLSAEYIWTPYGRVCSKMEILCIQCGKKDLVVVPDELIKMIDSEDLTGSNYAEYFTEQKGWIIKQVTRQISGHPALFMLCPDCIEKNFQAFDR